MGRKFIDAASDLFLVLFLLKLSFFFRLNSQVSFQITKGSRNNFISTPAPVFFSIAAPSGPPLC